MKEAGAWAGTPMLREDRGYGTGGTPIPPDTVGFALNPISEL
jgi:hypothetical protein